MSPADLAELQFFPALFGSLLSDGVDDKQDAAAIECGQLLAASRGAPAISAPPKVKTRSTALLRAALSAFRAPLVSEGAMVAQSALIAIRVMEEIVGSGYLVLHPGSDFERAVGLIRAGLVDVVDDTMRDRAEAEWPAALERVRAVGLFVGVRVVDVETVEMARAA